MNSNGRFNLTDWLENKKNRRIVLIIAVVLIAVVLIARVISRIGGIGEEMKLPDGGLLAEAEVLEREVPYYLNSLVSSDALGVTLAVPDAAEVKDDYLVCQRNDVVYVIGDGNAGVREVSETLYSTVYASVFGDKEHVSVGTAKQGYLGQLPAEYCTATVDMQVSTREITLYSIAYVVSVQEISGVTAKRLVLYACSESAEALNEAQVILKEIAYSVRKLDEEALYAPEEDGVDRPLGSDYFYPIDVYWYDESTGYENTVMVITWDNMLDEPGYLEVFGPMGQKGVMNEEYSYGGHYLYEFGVTNGGEYYIHGGTDKQLTNATISVLSMDEYMDLFHYVDANDGEVPDYILNREFDEEEY